jgi:hypothetical protein
MQWAEPIQGALPNIQKDLVISEISSYFWRSEGKICKGRVENTFYDYPCVSFYQFKA